MNLDQPIIEVIKDPEYRKFMSRDLGSKYYSGYLRHANDNSHDVFKETESIRSVWNRYASAKPIFCGGWHENPMVNIVVARCKNKNNVCCYHPESSQIFHTFGVLGYLATLQDHTFEHPSNVIKETIDEDIEINQLYLKLRSSVHPFKLLPDSRERVGKILLTAIQKQKRLLDEVKRPYMVKVGDILRGVA